MPNITQPQVMNQAYQANGHETCGYHTFKNSLLSLLFLQKKITEAQFNNLITRTDVFNSVYQATQATVNRAGDVDVTLPRFIELLRKTNAAEFDFLTLYGVTKANLIDLLLKRDGTENISVANFYPDPNMLSYGHLGMEDDLFAAAAIAKLAISRGEARHVFALGINNKHWLTAAVTQNARGERTWLFMDSWFNQTMFKNTAIANLESILTKSKPELHAYLTTAYQSSSDLFNRSYERFFFADTGLAKPGKVGGFGQGGKETRTTKEFFIDDGNNLEHFTLWIKNRFTFMQTVGWLSSPNVETQMYAKQLFHMTDYIVQNTTDNVIKTTLMPMLESLRKTVFEEQKEPDDTVPLPEPTPEDISVNNDATELQTSEALKALDKTPKPTEGFDNILVRAIVFLLKGLRSAREDVGRSIGLVS